MQKSLHLFFDLDGTLSDSAEGISACIQHALAGLDRELPSLEEIRPFIGSPLRGIFESLLADDAGSAADGPPVDSPLLDRAIALYRERFDARGYAENRLYPDVREGLEQLRRNGHALYIATAKRPEDALRVARHFAIDGLFAGIFGAQSEDERRDKARLLARALQKSNADSSHSVMIGDRSHDMLAAVRAAATPLGAGWGYGSDAELRDAGALHIAASPAEMTAWIGERHGAARLTRRRAR